MAFCARATLHFLRPSCALLILALAVLHAGAEHAQQKASTVGKESHPTVTLRGVLRGTGQELHRYVESFVGIDAIRSVTEVK